MIHRPDFTAVAPTEEEKVDWDRRYPNRRGSYPYRAVHECGTRIWYSGLAVASHMRGHGRRKDY